MDPSRTYFYLSTARISSIYKGTIKANLSFQWPISFPAPSIIYIYQHHTYVPYQVAQWHVKNYSVKITLRHPSFVNQIEQKKGYDIFIGCAWVYEALKKNFSFEYLVFCQDFKVIDEKGKEIGVLERIQERKIQPLMVIDGGEQSIDIPVHEKFIKHIDLKQRCITVQWP